MASPRRLLEQQPMAAAVAYTVVGVLPLYFTTAQAVRLQDELSFGRTEFGLVVAGFYLISSIASRSLGATIDRIGITRGFRIGAVLSIASSLTIAAAGNRWYLLSLFLGIAGLSNAFAQLASNRAVATEVGGRRQGLGFGLKQAAVPTGALIAGLAVPWVGFAVSWRWVYLGAAAMAAVFAFLAPHYPHTPPGPHRQKARLTVPLLGLTITAALAGGLGNSMASFVVDAAQSIDFSPGTAARLLSMGSFTAIAMRVFLGWSADRRQRRGVAELAGTLALSTVGFVVLAASGSNQTVFVAGVVLSFAGAWGWPGVIYYVVTRSTDLPAATATGWVLAGAYLGTVIWPPIFGLVAEEFSYTAAFTIGAVTMAVAMTTALLTQRYVTDAAPITDREHP